MNIICPECGKIHNLPDERIPSRKSSAKCKKCGARMIINPRPTVNSVEELNQDSHNTGPNESDSREFDVLLTDRCDENSEGKSLHALVAEESEAFDLQNITAADKTTTINEISAAFPELQGLTLEKFVFEEILSISESKNYRTKENILKIKIVKAVHDILTLNILHENEKVLRVAKGIAYYPFEFLYANGILNILSNYFAIICTSQRLLFINTDRRIKHPTRYIFQVPYHEINNIGRGAFLSSLIIESKSGRCWNFTTLKRNLAKSLKLFIVNKCKENVSESAIANSLNQLCPACYTPLPEKLASCPHCSAIFKKPAEAFLRSLVLPGLGTMYLSYMWLGLMEMVGYIAIWLLAILLMIIEIPGGLTSAIAPILSYHLITSFLAKKAAGKGYILAFNRTSTPVDIQINHEDSSKDLDNKNIPEKLTE